VTGVYQRGVFYNRAIFAQYHLSVPKTYNQLMADAKILSSHGVTPFLIGLQNVGPAYLQFIYFPLMQDIWRTRVGGNLNTALWTNRTQWTSPEFKTVLERTVQTMHYLEPNFTGVSWESMPGDFADGKAAMLLDGSWDLASVHQANPSLKVGYFPFPGSNHPQYNQSLVSGDLTFAVLADAPDKSAAFTWLKFFAQPKIYAQYVDETGISPTETGVYHSFSASVLGRYFGTGVHLSQSFPVLPANGPYWVQQTNWPKLILDVYDGKYTVTQAANMLQSEWETVTGK
jgi:raffinose/stachyose/melibiose transport system substrate-binding protein